MADKVDINDAKVWFAQLVARAEAGDETTIIRDGRPVARLVPFRSAAVTRRPGRMRGRIRIGRDFDAPLPGDLFGPR